MIIIIGAFFIGWNFFLPQYIRPVMLIIGLIIGLVGVLELSHHSKECDEYCALMEQLKTIRTFTRPNHRKLHNKMKGSAKNG